MARRSYPLRRLTVENLPVDAVVPYPGNPRVHSEDQIDEIANAIIAFGWTNPILIDGERGVIAGHGRLAAARKLGMDQVPCIRLMDLTYEQRRALVIADNKLALNAGWDDKLLAIELSALSEYRELVGFSTDELARILGSGTAGLTEDDAVPPTPAN